MRMDERAAIAVALALLVAFAGGQPLPRDPAAVSAPGKFPVVSKPVTLKVFIPSVGLIKDVRTNSTTAYMERLTGVKIEWIETSKVDAKNRLSIMMASGDYPDVIVGMSGSGLSIQDLYRYGSQGRFLALNALIEKQGFYVKELFAAEPGMKRAITSANGKIYGLPAVFTDDYHMTMRQKMWINKAWLDKLGPQDADHHERALRRPQGLQDAGSRTATARPTRSR